MIWWGFFRLTAQAAMPLPVGLTKARTLKVSRDFKKSHKTFETCENWKFQCKIQWKLSFWGLLLRNFKKIWNFLSKIYFFAEIFVVILFVALLHSRNISSFPCQKHKKIFYETFKKRDFWDLSTLTGTCWCWLPKKTSSYCYLMI